MRANKENNVSFAKKFVTGVAIALGVIVFFALMTAAGLVIYVNTDTDVDENALVFENSVPEVYDANGELTTYCSANEIKAESGKIPDHLKNAFVALEDKRFYEHRGVDYIRILGATVANLKSGSKAQGGSTITQQIVKNAFLSGEKSFSRKLREARLAVSLERRMTKDEILETYLNMLYFGSGEYGVKNAARRFFGCEVEDLTIAQSAMLAGIVKSPTKYNPINHFDNAFARSRLVLGLMLEQDMITKAEYDEATGENIAIVDDKSAYEFDKTYVVNALGEACSILGIDEKELRVRGYKLYTFLDLSLQSALKNIIDDDSMYKTDDTLSAAIDVDAASGGIRAAYSNLYIDFFSFRRQSGSVLKPLACYAPAFESGLYSPASILNDEPTDFGGYAPENYGKKYYGKVSVRDALSMSLNVPAVSVLSSIGVQNGYNALKAMNFSLSDSDDNLSLALGSSYNGTTFIELLGGYLTLASNGEYKDATFISRIEDADGNTVYERNSTKAKRIFSEESAYLTTDCLMQCATDGTAKKLSSLPFQVAAKTGTVASGNGNADAYNISYTTDSCVLFWQGSERYDTPLPSSVTGGGLPSLMAKTYLSQVFTDEKPFDFIVPAGIKTEKLDKIAYEEGNLVLASDNAPDRFTVEDIFAERFLPTEKDNSFDYPSADGVDASVNGKTVTINFAADPHICYKVVKKSLFADDEIILCVENKEGTVSVTDEADGLLGYNRYVIVSYYFDNDGRETIGEIIQIPVGW